MNVAGDNRILQAKNQLKDMIQKEPRMQHKWSDTKWINDIVTILGAPNTSTATFVGTKGVTRLVTAVILVTTLGLLVNCCHPRVDSETSGLKLWPTLLLRLNFGSTHSVHLSFQHTGWQKLREGAKGLQRKIWSRKKVLSPNIWVILRCWGNSSILCQQNSDAL